MDETINLMFYNPQKRLIKNEKAINESGINQQDGLKMSSVAKQVFSIPTD